MKIHTIDLKFLGNSQTIAAFLVETGAGPVLVETGPHSTFVHLEAGIHAAGFRTEDVKHVLLSHIHFDHAGAAWAMAEKGAQIYVHSFGAHHLQDPSKLTESARRIYLDKMDFLWGAINPIAAEKIVVVEDQTEYAIGGLLFKAWHTPGHAVHHIAWQVGKTIFTGDVAGVHIGTGPVIAPCPPPDIDLEQWQSSINLLRSLQPETLYLTHFGAVTAIEAHFQKLEANLQDQAQWVKQHWEAGEDPAQMPRLFDEHVRQQLLAQGLSEEAISQYQGANPSDMSVAGLLRYWKKRSTSV
jgi:glyoxylase-like metal-dependent hydrolase (beta-lactamase superfamily II)